VVIKRDFRWNGKPIKNTNGFIGYIHIIYIVGNCIMDKFDWSAVVRLCRLDIGFWENLYTLIE